MYLHFLSDSIFCCYTYCALHTEHMAVVFARLYVPGDVGKEVEVLCVLARTEYVPDFMITDHFLQTTNHR